MQLWVLYVKHIVHVVWKILGNEYVCLIWWISTKTSMKIDDIVSTLDTLGLLRMWKGQYVAMISEEVISKGMWSFVDCG